MDAEAIIAALCNGSCRSGLGNKVQAPDCFTKYPEIAALCNGSCRSGLGNEVQALDCFTENPEKMIAAAIRNDPEIIRACILRMNSPRLTIEFLKVYFTRAAVSVQVTSLDKFFILFLGCCCLEKQADSNALYGPTCSIVASRVLAFISDSENMGLVNTFSRFDNLAVEWLVRPNQFIQDEISELFVNSFVPAVSKFFMVPKPYWFCYLKIVIPKENILLANFVNFLIQILDSEASIGADEEHRYADFKKELTILHLYLEDELFWGSIEGINGYLAEVVGTNRVLADAKMVVNEAGKFIYSFVFTTRPTKSILFFAGKHSVLRKFKCLNANMHTLIFSPSPPLLSDRLEDLRFIMSCRRSS